MAEGIDLKVHLEKSTKCTGCKMMSQSSDIEAHRTAAPSTSPSHVGQSSDIPVSKGKFALVLQAGSVVTPSNQGMYALLA